MCTQKGGKHTNTCETKRVGEDTYISKANEWGADKCKRDRVGSKTRVKERADRPVERAPKEHGKEREHGALTHCKNCSQNEQQPVFSIGVPVVAPLAAADRLGKTRVNIHS
jgi:hypothetical protein